MLNKLNFFNRQVNTVIEHGKILFPISILQCLLAQSASAEVRRRYEFEANIFEEIKTNTEFQTAFIDSYVQANLKYFELIKSQIPADCCRLLDIGCGIGLLDLLIYRNIRGKKPKLFLFDKSVEQTALSKTDIAPTGFNEHYVFTASLGETAKFLRLNGVADSDIVLCEVGAWAICNGGPFDLIFSRKSWGFHYPLMEYLAEVSLSLSEHGVVIMDVRSGHGGEALLHEYFDNISVLEQGNKSSLIMAQTTRTSRKE
jgi:SAM-dependent methyltransferase